MCRMNFSERLTKKKCLPLRMGTSLDELGEERQAAYLLSPS